MPVAPATMLRTKRSWPGTSIEREPAAVGELERRVAEIDRDPARLLLGQPVGVLPGQRPDEPRLAVVDVSRGAYRERHARTASRDLVGLRVRERAAVEERAAVADDGDDRRLAARAAPRRAPPRPRTRSSAARRAAARRRRRARPSPRPTRRPRPRAARPGRAPPRPARAACAARGSPPGRSR